MTDIVERLRAARVLVYYNDPDIHHARSGLREILGDFTPEEAADALEAKDAEIERLRRFEQRIETLVNVGIGGGLKSATLEGMWNELAHAKENAEAALQAESDLLASTMQELQAALSALATARRDGYANGYATAMETAAQIADKYRGKYYEHDKHGQDIGAEIRALAAQPSSPPHKQGCPADGGYGNGKEPCICGATAAGGDTPTPFHDLQFVSIYLYRDLQRVARMMAEELKEIREWAKIEKKPLRPLEIASIEGILAAWGALNK